MFYDCKYLLELELRNTRSKYYVEKEGHLASQSLVMSSPQGRFFPYPTNGSCLNPNE